MTSKYPCNTQPWLTCCGEDILSLIEEGPQDILLATAVAGFHWPTASPSRRTRLLFGYVGGFFLLLKCSHGWEFLSEWECRVVWKNNISTGSLGQQCLISTAGDSDWALPQGLSHRALLPMKATPSHTQLETESKWHAVSRGGCPILSSRWHMRSPGKLSSQQCSSLLPLWHSTFLWCSACIVCQCGILVLAFMFVQLRKG